MPKQKEVVPIIMEELKILLLSSENNAETRQQSILGKQIKIEHVETGTKQNIKLTILAEDKDYLIFLTEEEFAQIDKLIKPHNEQIIIFSPVVSQKDVESGMLKRIPCSEYFKNVYSFFNEGKKKNPPNIFQSGNYIIISEEIKQDSKVVPINIDYVLGE